MMCNGLKVERLEIRTIEKCSLQSNGQILIVSPHNLCQYND